MIQTRRKENEKFLVIVLIPAIQVQAKTKVEAAIRKILNCPKILIMVVEDSLRSLFFGRFLILTGGGISWLESGRYESLDFVYIPSFLVAICIKFIYLFFVDWSFTSCREGIPWDPVQNWPSYGFWCWKINQKIQTTNFKTFRY